MKINTSQYERDLIAVIITTPDLEDAKRVVDGVTPDMFSGADTKRAWQAISEIHNEQSLFDMIGVSERMGGCDDFIWLAEITSSSVATRSQLLPLAKRVRQSAYLMEARRRIMASLEVIDELTDVSKVNAIAGSIGEIFEGLLLETNDKKPQLFKDVAKDYVTKLTDKLNGKADEHIVLTGISDLDYHTGGFNKTDLIVMAGLSGSGKTEAVIDVIRGTTAEDGGALIFSLEMSNSQVVERAISGQSQLPVSALRNPKVLEETPNGWPRMERGLGELVNRDIYMEDQTGLTIHDIVTRAKRHKRDFPDCKLVAVDHIGLMNLGKIQTRHDLAVGEITKELKNLAKEIETPVVVLSQLTGKQIMQRPVLEREPRAQDIKDSSRIEEDADLIIMLHRQYTHDEKAPNIAEWILAKARHAIKGTKVYFRFVDGHFIATDQAHAHMEMERYSTSLTPTPKSKPANLK